MQTPVALQKIKHHPPLSCLCSVTMESPLLKILATVGISALGAQMVVGKCQIIAYRWGSNRRRAPWPSAWSQEVITTSVCTTTWQLSLDRYLIFACSRAASLLVEGPFFFFKKIDKKLALAPGYIKWSRFPRQNCTIISVRPACIFPGPSLCNLFAKSYMVLCTGSTAGRLLRRRLWLLLCPAQAGCCSAVIFKNSSEGNSTKDCIISMGHGTMSGCNHTASEQQIPIYLQIRYPAGAICLSVVTYHPASTEGPAVSPLRLDCGLPSRPAAGPLHSARQQVAGWWNASGVSGWASAHWYGNPGSFGLALPRRPEPPQTQGRHRKSSCRLFLSYNSKIIITYRNAHT